MVFGELAMHLGILGAGAFGTSLGLALANNFTKITLYAMEHEVVESINNNHKNELYLPKHTLPLHLKATNNLEHLSSCHIILITTPTQHIRSSIKQVFPINRLATYIVCSKGLEISSKKLISQIIQEEVDLPNLAVLSGPSFAHELAQSLPTTLILAMNDITSAKTISALLQSKTLRIYHTSDLIGAQVGGGIKNVIAIASGIIKGANLGHNALAGLITRGMHEMLTLNNIYGGDNKTIFGLSGLGDLILTATSEQSRNFSLGYKIGERGYFDDSFIKQSKGLCEGYYTAKAINELIEEHDLIMPISKEVYQICYNYKHLKNSIDDLMNRDNKQETLVL